MTSNTTSSVFPGSPHHGKGGARKFCEELTANLRTDGEEVLHRQFRDDSMILEQIMSGAAIGSLFGLPGHGRQISFASCTSSSSATG
jgi:hypothetical protein